MNNSQQNNSQKEDRNGQAGSLVGSIPNQSEHTSDNTPLSQRIKELEEEIDKYMNENSFNSQIGAVINLNNDQLDLIDYKKSKAELHGLKQGAELQRTEMLEKIKRLDKWKDIMKTWHLELPTIDLLCSEFDRILKELIKELEKSE